MEYVALEEKFRVPLDPEEKSVSGRFDGFDHAVRRNGTGDQGWSYGFHGLMVGAIHHHRGLLDDSSEQAAWCDRYGVGHMDRLGLLPMGQDAGHLGRQVLKEAATKGHVEGLHPAADAQQGEVALLRVVDEIQLEVGAALADKRKFIALTLSVKTRRKIGSASGQEQPVYAVQEAAPSRCIGDERQDEGNSAEFFDGANVARPQKIGGLMPTPFFPVTGIKVWRDADDGFHVTGLVQAHRWCLTIRCRRLRRGIGLGDRRSDARG
jgi:hypothetical protein